MLIDGTWQMQVSVGRAINCDKIVIAEIEDFRSREGC